MFTAIIVDLKMIRGRLVTDKTGFLLYSGSNNTKSYKIGGSAYSSVAMYC